MKGRKVLKGVGIFLGSIVGLIALLLIVSYFVSESRMKKQYDIPVTAIAVTADSAHLARGAHLSQILGCRDCHGDNFAGKVLVDDTPFLVASSNLTSGQGGVGPRYDLAGWDRAIRHGVGHDGRALYVMPTIAYAKLSDDDFASLVTYLQTLPPVDNTPPRLQLRPLGRALVAAGAIKPEVDLVDHTAPRTVAPPAGPTPEYGDYLASITCRHCHGANLEGAPHPDPAGPHSPDLRAAANWSEADFTRVLRTGETPDGRRLDPKFMPWSAFQAMTDEEIRALHSFLKTLQPVNTQTASR